jgi:hypothetical protein
VAEQAHSGVDRPAGRRQAAVVVIVRSVGGSVVLVDGAAGPALPAAAVRTGEDPRSAASRVLAESSLPVPPGRILALDYQPLAAAAAEAITFVYDGGTYDGGELAAGAGGQAVFLPVEQAEAVLDSAQSAQLAAGLRAHELLTVVELRNGQVLRTAQSRVPERELAPQVWEPEPAGGSKGIVGSGV